MMRSLTGPIPELLHGFHVGIRLWSRTLIVTSTRNLFLTFRQATVFAMNHEAIAKQKDQRLFASASSPENEDVMLNPRPEGLFAVAFPTDANVPQTAEADPISSANTDNLKRSDPFQFGSRYLQVTDDVYEFNAWDHVETDDTYKEYAEIQYAKQREAPVSAFDQKRFNSEPAKWWNQFYKNNTSNFFKDRKWLRQEFPILSEVTRADIGSVTLLEIGAGAGNTAFPILAHNHNPLLKIHACDFSKIAVEVIRENEAYDRRHIQADIWDASGEQLPPGLTENSVDIVLMIFVFSALSPLQWQQAVQNVYKLLKPGGEVLFRDYGRGDLAQVRFKKGRYLQENFYIRGDGTRVYFFEKDELVKIWTGLSLPSSAESSTNSDNNGQTAFEIINLGVDRRLLVNRGKQLKMYRCWMQGRFRKPSVLKAV